jgi:D-serine deaminase-like pyridoxal phosphate-dependent protein
MPAMPRVPFAGLALADYELPAAVVERTLSPALVIHLERVRENVRRVIARAGGPDRWRPHVKTTKIPEVFAEVARAGVRNFKCATTREARELALALERQGIEGSDVLLAYPLVGPALGELGRIAALFPATRFSVLCEDPALVREIPAAVSIFVDVDPGMHRTGVPLEERATIRALARAAGPRFRGLHYYEGHLHQPDLAERRAAVFAGYAPLLELCADLEEHGARVGEVVTSGTPAFTHALAFPGFRVGFAPIHRASPGTVVFHDLRTEEENSDLELLPAATVLTRVVSHPRPGIATCDAGSKSLAAESGDPCAFVIGHPELVPLTPSEEHLPLSVTSGERPRRGDVLHLVPRHVCPTVNLAEEALLVEGGEVRIVAVSARAHDLVPR